MPRALDVPVEPVEPGELAASGPDRVQFACSRFFREGWLNTDLASFTGSNGVTTALGGLYRIGGRFLFHRLDATEPLPWPDGAFRAAYAEHFVEHVERDAAVAWLREVRRVLAPGALARITTPDLARYAEGYVRADAPFFAEHHARLVEHPKYRDAPRRRAWMLNQIFYLWGHRWIYDFDELCDAAAAAGFDPGRARRCEYAEGADPALAALDLEARRDETLYVELER